MALTKLPGFTLDNSGNFTFANANVTGNLTSGNANLGNAVRANFFIGNGSLLTGLPAGYTNSDVANYLPTYTGNISASNANLGNAVRANFFLGDGSLLTGISATTAVSLINGNSNVIVTANSNVTISAVGTSNVVTVTGTGASISGAFGVTGNTTLNNLSVTGTTILSNLTVTGTTTTVNSTTSQLTDPLIELGGGANGAALTTNDNGDRGLLLHYYTTAPVDAFIGYKNANSEFVVASNVSNTTNIVTINSLANLRANFFIGDGSRLTNLAPSTFANGNSNIVMEANGPIIMSAVGSYSVLTVGRLGANVGGTLGISGNLTAANANLGNVATANFFTGTLTGSSANQSNITTVGQLTNLSVLGNANVGANANIVGNLTTGNANLGNAVRANFFLGDGSLLTGIGGAGYIFNGNSNANIATANGNLTVSIAGVANVGIFSSLGLNVSGYVSATGNINATGNLTAGNANLGNAVRANFFLGDGSLLTGIGGAGYIFNGSSNANIATANGNLSIGINGVANTAVFSSTGVNLAGFANVVGNITAGNVYANTGTIGASLLTGTITTNSQPNITSLGNLSILNVVGQANVGNLVTPTTINAVGTITGGNFTTGGNLSVTGNSNVGNINGGIATFTGNISGANANLGNSVVANFFIGNFYGPANTAGTVTINAQPNITSVGNLTGLTVNGNVSFSNGSVTLGSVGNVKLTGGSLNQYLKTDGTGNLSWGTPSGGGGGGTALTYTAATTPPISANIADQWYNTSTDVLYQYVNDGTTSYWVDVSTPTVSSAIVSSILTVKKDGVAVGTSIASIDFTGQGINASGNSTSVTVTVSDILSPFLLMGA